MIFKPWDCAQPDEWLPQSLRLCWGDSGGFGGGSGGGGFSGDSGGWGGDSGATTGGGDWGSSGSYDASGFNAGGDLGAWAGSAYDASTAGTGMGGGGDWGSFGDTNYGGMNAPNPTFADVAGPNPGVTTGGGDWGSAGMFSAEGTGGGPGGAMSGAGGGFYGGGGGGGVFGDYGGGGGYTGGGGGGYGGGYGGGGGGGYVGGGGQQGGGAFGSFGSGTFGASNAVSSVSGPAFADTAGPGSLTGPAGQASSGAPTTSEAQSESAGGGETTSDSDAAEEGDTSVAPSESQFGTPSETSEAEAEAQTDAAPEVSSTIAASRETNFDYGPSAAPEAQPSTQPSHFGPQSVNADYEGSPYASDYDQAPTSQSYQNTDYEGSPYASDYDQSPQQEAAPGWFESLTQDTSRDDPSTLPGAISNWLGNILNAPVAERSFELTNPWTAPVTTPAVRSPFEAPQWAQNPRSFEVFDPKADTQAQARIDARPLSDINTWLSEQNQNPISTSIFNAITGALSPVNEASSMGRTAAPDTTPWGSVFEGAAPPADTWAALFEGAAPPAQDLASQLGTESIDTTPWGSVFEAPAQAPNYEALFEAPAQAPNYEALFEGAAGPTQAYQEASQQLSDLTQTALAPQDINWGAIFEGAAPETGIDPGAEQYGIEARTPTIEAFIPAAQETNFDYGPTATEPAPAGEPSFDALPGGQPGAPPTTDDASTPGGDPALSGLSADAAAAAAAAAAAVGAPGVLGQPGTQGQPATAPAQGGQTFVSEAAVSAIANATSNAALDVGAPPQAGDAASQAAHNAALNLANPTEIATAAMAAALENGATQAQADAIAAAALNAANNQPAFTPGQPGQQQQAPPGQQQPGAPFGPEAPSTTSTIAGGRATDFQYAPSQPAPQSLIDMAQSGINPGAEQYGTQSPSTPPASALPPVAPADTPSGTPGGLPTGQLGGAKGVYDAPPWQGPTTGDRYLSEVYDRVPTKIDSTGNFTWKDPASAARLGMEKNEYTIGGLNPDVKTIVEAMGKAMDKANVPWTITAAYRDNYRQGLITSGFRASPTGSQHGGTSTVPTEPSLRGGIKGGEGGKNAATPAQIAKGGETYGLGKALDVTGVRGNQGQVWNWIDQNGAKFNIVRPYGKADPSHIQPTGDFRALAAKIRAGFDPLTGKYQTEDGKPDPNFARKQEAQDRAQREAARNVPRPPADIPPAAPPQPEVAQPRPPADIPAPTNLPPVAPPDPVAPRPPADIPVTLTPPVRGQVDRVTQTQNALNIIKDSTAKLTTSAGQAEFNAAGVVAAKGLAAAGVPLALARDLMTRSAYQGAEKVGYGPSATLWSLYKSHIDSGIAAALQGYQPAKPGEVQGPPSPFAPGKQGAAPFGLQYAGLSQSTGPAPESYGRGTPSLQNLSPIINPQPTLQDDWGWGKPPAPPPPLYTPDTPGQFSPFRGNEASLPGIILAAGGRDAGQPPAVSEFPGRDYGEGEIIGNPNLMIEDRGVGTPPPAPPRGLQDPNDPDRPFMITPPFNPDLPGERSGERQALLEALFDTRFLAKGGHVDKDEKVVVGEEGPEFFIPDEPGTVVPHMPPGGGGDFGRWPKLPTPDYPGRYAGVGREMKRQMRAAQDPVPTLMDMVDYAHLNAANWNRITNDPYLRLNAANWHAMLNDPSLIALGQSRIEDRINGGPEPQAVAAEPPDPNNPMAQALGYGSIKRRPMQIGRQSY